MILRLRHGLHVLLMLLVIASGLVAAAQTAHHVDTHAGAQPSTFGWHSHDDAHHDHHGDLYDVATAEDEHGHHFHVHLPLQALMSAQPLVAWSGSSSLQQAPNSPVPHSLALAPPVPPPNA
jgi:hypothetical protein